jgi:hypothetical protein
LGGPRASFGAMRQIVAAHSMRASAQVTAPGAITSMIVAVSTRPKRQNKSTCSRMSLSTKAEVEAGKPDRSASSAEPSPMSWPLGWSTPPRRQMRTSWWFWPCSPPGYLAGTSTRPSTKSAGLLEGRMGEMCELLHTSNHHCLDGNNERLL